MSVLVDLSTISLGQGESQSRFVTEALAVIRDSGLAHRLGPMGTAIEGEWDEVMAVVSRCHEVLRAHSPRVYMPLKIDSREGPGGRLDAKTARVEQRLAAASAGQGRGA